MAPSTFVRTFYIRDYWRSTINTPCGILDTPSECELPHLLLAHLPYRADLLFENRCAGIIDFDVANNLSS
jgi:hypothetical protein